MTKNKPGPKPKYKVKMIPTCVRVAEQDQEELRKFEKKLQRRHLRTKASDK